MGAGRPVDRSIDATVMALIKEGQSMAEIGVGLGVTQSAVAHRVARIRRETGQAITLPRGLSTLDARQVAARLSIVSLRAKGKTLKEIGDVFGISRERVRQVIAQKGKRS